MVDFFEKKRSKVYLMMKVSEEICKIVELLNRPEKSEDESDQLKDVQEWTPTITKTDVKDFLMFIDGRMNDDAKDP